MERSANYAAVGAFVLVVTLVAALFVYWYTDSREHRDFNRYEVYFDASVSGLERGSSVRYLGVGVGRVDSMRIDPRDSSRVMVVVDIDATTPISRKTVAELTLQGVTGLLFMDLLQPKHEHSDLLDVPSFQYPVIRSRDSGLQTFLQSLPELATRVGDVVERADRLLSDQNLAAFSNTLANVNKASNGLPQTLHDVNELLAELRGATGQISASARDLRSILDTAGPDVEATISRLHAVADNIAKASDLIDKIIADNRQDIRSFTRDGLPELERFLREGRAAAEEIRALSSSLRENPSQLLYQQEPKGVEIPR
jgi:phospholipid/cholesterol/gamma-HCH transport system substrate-binding protein